MHNPTDLVNCPDCFGQGRIENPCGICDGTGSEQCIECSGYGREFMDGPMCRVCRGSGKTHPCTSCAGRGHNLDRCYVCEGAGKVSFQEFQRLTVQRKAEEQRFREDVQRRKEQEEKRRLDDARLRQEQEREKQRQLEADAPRRTAVAAREARKIAATKARNDALAKPESALTEALKRQSAAKLGKGSAVLGCFAAAVLWIPIMFVYQQLTHDTSTQGIGGGSFLWFVAGWFVMQKLLAAFGYFVEKTLSGTYVSVAQKALDTAKQNAEQIYADEQSRIETDYQCALNQAGVGPSTP